MVNTCISCSTNIMNQASVRFKCPSCNKQDILRCEHCRAIVVKYKCPCGFEGP